MGRVGGDFFFQRRSQTLSHFFSFFFHGNLKVLHDVFRMRINKVFESKSRDSTNSHSPCMMCQAMIFDFWRNMKKLVIFV